MDNLSPEQLAEELHNVGLDAYRGYEFMGKSAQAWNDFRLTIARRLLEKLDVIRKVGDG